MYFLFDWIYFDDLVWGNEGFQELGVSVDTIT